MRRALFIGGTGTISTSVVRRLLESGGWEVWLLNRGSRSGLFDGPVHEIRADIHDPGAVSAALAGKDFDCVCEFIGFTEADVRRDYELFRGRTEQYIFTSSASAYHKPAASYIVSEGTSLANPYWEYSRGKIACEDFLMRKYREEQFPVTIVRPSHTYCERSIPTALHGAKGSWQVISRMMNGKPVIVHGDGSSLWTLTFSTDFAIGYCGLMGCEAAIGEAFQITGDETLTWDQIYRTIGGALGVTPHLLHVSSDFLAAAGRSAGYDFRGALLGDKAVSVCFDNRKLKRLVPQMRTNVPFHEGVRIALAYIQEHPECRREDPDFDAWCDKVVRAQEAARHLFDA